VDDDVEAAKVLNRRVDELLGLAFASDIGGDRVHLGV
jgi:hypothetical protein